MIRTNATRLTERLWIGGYPPEGGYLESIGVDVLVLCAAELQDAHRFPGVNVVQVPLHDSVLERDAPDMRAVYRAARAAARAWHEGKRVLITCAQGRNRSALVASYVLSQIIRRDPARCGKYIRSVRKTPHGRALDNWRFREILKQDSGWLERPRAGVS